MVRFIDMKPEQWEQQGIQKGVKQNTYTIASKMLKCGISDQEIIEITSPAVVNERLQKAAKLHRQSISASTKPE
jgi:hypothetical protein